MTGGAIATPPPRCAPRLFFGLPALYTVAGVILAYPWFFMPVLVVVCAVVVDRRNRPRAAIAARADSEHRALIAASLRWPVLPAHPRSAGASPSCAATTGTDHCSPTNPIRKART
ncbi:hypothetical protein [Mycobacterium lentiflavum]|uniref:hypothetical protein n=1 Tax=Mycobacterium lentiflavum TaxID=141349 RepID=UPI000B11F3E3|nr:hypothetical protein [Mycobacterium lentiflavum]